MRETLKHWGFYIVSYLLESDFESRLAEIAPNCRDMRIQGPYDDYDIANEHRSACHDHRDLIFYQSQYNEFIAVTEDSWALMQEHGNVESNPAHPSVYLTLPVAVGSMDWEIEGFHWFFKGYLLGFKWCVKPIFDVEHLDDRDIGLEPRIVAQSAIDCWQFWKGAWRLIQPSQYQDCEHGFNDSQGEVNHASRDAGIAFATDRLMLIQGSANGFLNGKWTNEQQLNDHARKFKRPALGLSASALSDGETKAKAYITAQADSLNGSLAE